MKVIQIDCPKCGGTGNLPQYSHINQGICFKCDGTGRVNMNVREDMDDFVLKVFPGLYVEHEYSEHPDFQGEDSFYYQASRKKHNETLVKFLKDNEELKQSVDFLDDWAKKTGFEDPSFLYTASYTSEPHEGAMGCVYSSNKPFYDKEAGKPLYIRGGIRYWVEGDAGFLDSRKSAQDVKYDTDNTFMHEMIHVVDMINQSARLLGKPDSDKRKRVAQAKANVLDDYIMATTGNSVKLYEKTLVNSPLAVNYLNVMRAKKVREFTAKVGRAYIDKGMSERLSEYVREKSPADNSIGGATARHRNLAITSFSKGDFEEGQHHIDEMLKYLETSLKATATRQYGIDRVTSSGKDSYLQHLSHIPLHIAFKQALNDNTYVNSPSGENAKEGDIFKKDLEDIVKQARATFRDMRTSESQNNTLNEILYYADEDLSYEDMDFLRRSYRVIRGIAPPEEGKTYIGTMKELRSELSNNPEKYRMGEVVINNIMTRMSFDYYLPSLRTDAYALYDSGEFNAELGSSMLGSKVRDEEYTEPMLELKHAFEDFYSWDSMKSYNDQSEKVPILEEIRGFLLEKRNEEERYSQEFYRAWEGIREPYLIPDEYVMEERFYPVFMDDMEYLEDKAIKATGKTLREVVGEESYESMKRIERVSFPQQILGSQLSRLPNLLRAELDDLATDLVDTLEWSIMNDAVVENFAKENTAQIFELYNYYTITNRKELRDAMLNLGIDLDEYEEEEEDF